MVAHACILTMQEAKTGGSQVQGQPGEKSRDSVSKLKNRKAVGDTA